MFYAYAPTGKKWVWAHQRNRSLLQANLFCDGLKGEGYFPAVRFSRKDYLSVFVENEGEYFFYDESELSRNTRLFQNDIDSGTCTPQKLRDLSLDFFEDVHRAAALFSSQDLSSLSNEDLLVFFRAFRKAMTVGPIITVQLWGIEACWDPAYRLHLFLKTHFEKQKTPDALYSAVETLSVTPEPLAPQAAELSFWRTAVLLQKDMAVADLFATSSGDGLERKLREAYPDALRAIAGHQSAYGWMTSEYKSEPWSFFAWLEKFREALRTDASSHLGKLENQHRAALEKKKRLLEQLRPPKEVLNILAVFEELLWQRDWSKGEYSKAFLAWRPLLKELARRMACPLQHVGFHTLDELEAFLEFGENVPPLELTRREKRCCALSQQDGAFKVFSKDVDSILEREGVLTHFSVSDVPGVEGTVACQGRAKGRVRVVTKASEREKVLPGEILVTYMTTVEFTHLFSRIAGLITDEGGMSSHAAIVSREFNLPCIIGTKKASRVFKTGDWVELDASNGWARKVAP